MTDLSAFKGPLPRALRTALAVATLALPACGKGADAQKLSSAACAKAFAKLDGRLRVLDAQKPVTWDIPRAEERAVSRGDDKVTRACGMDYHGIFRAPPELRDRLLKRLDGFVF